MTSTPFECDRCDSAVPAGAHWVRVTAVHHNVDRGFVDASRDLCPDCAAAMGVLEIDSF